ncbi:cytochrome c oxidase subunit II [Natrialbaceae archaeon AArc-T1-2]|uniref:cytochrome c oxidase subunit II n=1 Tax=Natrialbaceae archaeon AArc-T1-2 TaxID=3053904 RepID=UPI00255B29F7|nr:cytochrome c oxidase subunit II [Natrialbaceae archaeon AArc-T1-2]WIV66613.1 cytochrome c oxidase subunit II [Natrialbaceae archaeon AArc-T1-2]
MHVHQYEKLWLGAALVLIVAIIATITYGTVGLGIAMVDDSEETVNPSNLGEVEGFDDPGVTQVGENEYDVHVIAFQFGYEPGDEQLFEPIEVPEDSTVNFYVTSSDVIHSFSLVGTNVNTMVIPGEVATMTVEFDEPGEYGIVCNEYCGPDHHNMEGKLEVVPEDEFHLFELEGVEAPEDDEVELGADATFTATVSSDHHDERIVPVTLEIGEETLEEELAVGGDASADLELAVDTDALGAGEHDWTVTIEDETADGQLAVLEENETTEE